MVKTASGFILGCAIGAWAAIPADLPFQAPRETVQAEFPLATNALSLQKETEKSLPETPNDTDTDHLQFKKGSDGHFHSDVFVNGKKINFMIDTGASIMAISKKTAKEYGLLPKDTAFTQVGRTAGGKVRFAEIRLKEVRVGEYILKDVPAAVTDSDTSPSLLGMSFLKVVPRIVIENDVMRFENQTSNFTENQGSVRSAKTE